MEVLERARVYEGFLSVERAVVRYERFDGTMSEPVVRLRLERPSAVGVLLYDPQRDLVALVEQFRYPVYAAGDRGWLLEIVAGVVPDGEAPQAVARAEAWEEAGLQVERLDHLATCYLSPGGSSERVHIYAAAVSLGGLVARTGGLAAEGEDTRVRVLSRSQALRLVKSGGIADAKTIIALQALGRSAS